MKLSLITLQNIHNYGSILQALATQHLFETRGVNVEIVNYCRKDARLVQSLLDYVVDDSMIIKVVKIIVLIPTKIRYCYVWSRFEKKYLHTTKRRYSCIDDFTKHPISADIYCTGSDQVWNSDWNKGILPEMFLAYAPEEKMKTAFAASFGKNRLNNEEAGETFKYLRKYMSISVREKSAAEIIRSLGRFDVTQILDPTLLEPLDFWVGMIQGRVVKDKYVLVYQLNNNTKFDAYAKQFAKTKDMKLVRIGIRYDQMSKNGCVYPIPTVEQFLSLLYHADYVITDSFHAVAFCLNFKKQFLVIYPNEFSTRLSSIMELTGTQARLISDYDNYSQGDVPIEFNEIDRILENERSIAYNFIHRIVYHDH